MYEEQPDLFYVDQKNIQNLADQNAVNDFLRKEDMNNEDGADMSKPIHKLRKLIRKLVRKLPEPNQNIIYLRYWEDQSIEDISIALNLPPATVQFILTKTHELLKQQILVGISNATSHPEGEKSWDLR